MAGIGNQCKEVDGCSLEGSRVQRGILVARETLPECRADDISGEARQCDAYFEPTDHEIKRILKSKSSKTTADFYCPLADSLEWIDGPESPPLGQSGDATDSNSQVVATQRDACPPSVSRDNAASKTKTSINGYIPEKQVHKHTKADLISFLGCASFPNSSRKFNSISSSVEDKEDLTVIKVGNSRFYVPSVLCVNNNIAFTAQAESQHNNGITTEKSVKPKHQWRLPNGFSLGRKKSYLNSGAFSQSRKSWPNSESLKNVPTVENSSESSTGKKSNDDQKSVKHGVCRSQSDNSVQLSNSQTRCEIPCESMSQETAPSITERSSERVSPEDRHLDCVRVLADNIHSEESKIQTLDLPNVVYSPNCNCGLNRDRSVESNETLEFYDDGVFLEDRSPLGETVDSFQGYGVCEMCEGSPHTCSCTYNNSAQLADRRTNGTVETMCDMELLNSSYNFLETSDSPPRYYKYGDKSKDLGRVLCSNSCDNNDDVGDFIETDIPQAADRSSSQSSLRGSTSSNEEINVPVVSCSDLDCVNNDHYNESACWGLDEREENNHSELCHHPQEADLGKEGVFFSYAPNHNPSLIPGMFRRDTRNCYGRFVGAANDRRQSDFLSEQYLTRLNPRPRGRSDTSSIAKQSSSDSEISNLAYSDSSVLISPEFDMAGVELFVSNADVDRALSSDQGANYSPGKECDASSVTLRRNSSEEGFHEAEEELETCFISGAHASGNCCCPNDLSGSSPLQVNSHHGNLMSPSAAAESNSLNFHVQFPSTYCRNQNKGGEDTSVLPSDQIAFRRSKLRSQRQNHAAQNICPCRDNRCERTIHSSQADTLTNNITGEERQSHGKDEKSSSRCTTTCAKQRLRLRSLPGASTDPLLQQNPQEASPGDFPLTNKATDSLLRNGRVQTSDAQTILSNLLEQKRKEIYTKFGNTVEKVYKEVPQDRVMIWTEYEAFILQDKPVLSAPCGLMAVLNTLKALQYDISREKVTNAIQAKGRDEEASVPDYLFSRSIAGATAEGLLTDVTQLTAGSVIGRFFHFHPLREVHLLKWLAHWIRKGAVPIATLNLQKGCQGNSSIPDAWHHQMIYGVSSQGVHLTNPMEVISTEVLMSQLCSEAVLQVRRKDILSRYNDKCDLHKFLQQQDPRWQTMNVLGQVVNVLREETMARVTGYRAQVTSHVSIPAVYLSGISLYMRKDSPNSRELLNTEELPLVCQNMLSQQDSHEIPE